MSGKKTDQSAGQQNEKVVQGESNSVYAIGSYVLPEVYHGYTLAGKDYAAIVGLIKDPMLNNRDLRDLSIQLYNTNGACTNTIDYMTAMPTLDRVVVVHGADKKKRKKNKELMESTLRTIKDKEVVRDLLFRGMVEGTAFDYFETAKPQMSRNKFMSDYDVENILEINDLGINASIISLPTDYTKIVGIKNSSYVLAFNLRYFLDECNTEEDRSRKLRKYPKEIRDAWSRWKENSSGNSWVVLDNKKTITHKIRSKIGEPWGRPLVLAAIQDIMYSDYFTKTKRGVLDEVNNRIFYETFPEGKDKGTSALTQKQQKAQHDTIKAAVQGKTAVGGISFFSVAAGTKIDVVDSSNTDILDEKYESNLNDKIALDLGFAGALLNGVGSGSYAAQQQNLELITAQLFQWIEQIGAELNKCISENIIRDKRNWVECRYLPVTHVNKNAMIGAAKDLYLQGNGSLSLWASACGVSPDVYFALLDQELEENIPGKYPVHQTSFTLSAKDSAGRPKTDNPSENTIKSRANNGNAMPSPSDNN